MQIPNAIWSLEKKNLNFMSLFRAQLEIEYAKGLTKLHSRLSKAAVGLSG